MTPPPNVIFVPAPVATVEVIGTCTGWSTSGSNPIRSANGWVAGPYGTGSVDMDLRNDAFGAFLKFDTGASASAWLSSNSARDVEIVHDSGSYYWDNATGGGMSIFATVNIRLNLSGWSGTLPGATDAASINLA